MGLLRKIEIYQFDKKSQIIYSAKPLNQEQEGIVCNEYDKWNYDNLLDEIKNLLTSISSEEVRIK